MKETVKKVVASIMAMATISIFFSGCSKQDPTSSNSTPITSSISTSYTSSSVSSSLTPGTDISTDVTDDSLFHWVEEPTGSALAVSAAEAIESAEYEVGADSNEYGLPVIVKGDEKFMHSGNLMLKLNSDGEFVNESDKMLVRHVHEPNTDNGAKIYLYRDTEGTLCNDNLAANESIAARSDKFWKVLNGSPFSTDHNFYVANNAMASDAEVDIPDNALVWYNGITTDIRAKGEMIPLKVLTDDFMNILDYTKNASGYAFNLYTGIGTVGINAVSDTNSWVFSYSIPENCKLEQPDVTLPSTAISEEDGEVYVSGEVLTQVFKYFVFTFSSVDMGNGNTDDIAVIVTDNQDILKSNQSSQGDSSSNSDTSTDVSTSEPTSEPTSTPSSSSGSGETSKPTSSSSSNSNTSKPTGDTSSSSSSGGTSSSSSTTSKPSSTPVTSTWNPDAPGNKPGPYGGYYDAAGTLHVKKANMPKDSEGYPLASYTDEVGQPRMSKADKEAYDAETQRIWEGGHGSGGLTEDQWANARR